MEENEGSRRIGPAYCTWWDREEWRPCEWDHNWEYRWRYRQRRRPGSTSWSCWARLAPEPMANRSAYPSYGFWSWRLQCLVGSMDRRKRWATRHLPLVCVVKLKLVVVAVVSFLTTHRHQPPSRYPPWSLPLSLLFLDSPTQCLFLWSVMVWRVWVVQWFKICLSFGWNLIVGFGGDGYGSGGAGGHSGLVLVDMG